MNPITTNRLQNVNSTMSMSRHYLHRQYICDLTVDELQQLVTKLDSITNDVALRKTIEVNDKKMLTDFRQWLDYAHVISQPSDYSSSYCYWTLKCATHTIQLQGCQVIIPPMHIEILLGPSLFSFSPPTLFPFILSLPFPPFFHLPSLPLPSFPLP